MFRLQPLMRHLEDIFLPEKEVESKLTKQSSNNMFEYMESKYNDPSIQDILNLCTFLNPRFKFDYIKNNRLYSSTVDVIKGTVTVQQ